MEELIAMAKKFRESAARMLGDETLRKIAHELTENLCRAISVDWALRGRCARESSVDGQADPA
jgi:hypothetical protein